MPELNISQDPTPLENWGTDHWSTLLYLETVCVDKGGHIDREHMRTNRSIHPSLIHRFSKEQYPTRLRRGTLENHDDWSCVEDMIALGLCHVRFYGNRIDVSLTDLGWKHAGIGRKARADNNDYQGPEGGSDEL